MSTVRLDDGLRSCDTVIEVRYRPYDVPRRFCGESWCGGTCELPALIIPATDDWPELKAYSSMVACGPVMQRWRVKWAGAKVEIPETYWPDFLKMMWW